MTGNYCIIQFSNNQNMTNGIFFLEDLFYTKKQIYKKITYILYKIYIHIQLSGNT